MKLYEIPEGSKIKAETHNDKGEKMGDFITYHHIDGMYSFCTIDGMEDVSNDGSNICHLGASQDLEKEDDYYILSTKREE